MDQQHGVGRAIPYVGEGPEDRRVRHRCIVPDAIVRPGCSWFSPHRQGSDTPRCANIAFVGHILAIDLGTTGLKVAVVAADGTVLGTGGERHTLRLLPDGGAEQDPEEWWQAIGRCSRRLVERASDIAAIAVTSQYMSLVAVDDHGLPLSACQLWMDRRGADLHPMLGRHEHLGLFLERHGLPPLPTDNVAHLYRLLADHPELSTARFVEPGDSLTARFTGRVTATQTTVLGMLASDNRRWGVGGFDDELLSLVGIEERQLAPLVPAGSVVGTVTAETAEHLGVSRRTVVLTASIDTITSAVGTGAVDASSCGLIVGTTSVLVTHVVDKRSDLANGILTLPSSLPDRWFVMAENGVAGKALEQAAVLTGYGSVDDALADAASAPVGCSGVAYAPWLVGSMAPGGDDKVRGGWVGLGLEASRNDMIRAVLEGVALNAAWLFAPFQALTGSAYDHVIVGGGGARSELWMQAFADCLGLPIHRLRDPQTSNVVGAATLARVQLGELALGEVADVLSVDIVFDPDPVAHSALQSGRERLIELHRHLGAWQRGR
jgi:xylulokinase